MLSHKWRSEAYESLSLSLALPLSCCLVASCDGGRAHRGSAQDGERDEEKGRRSEGEIKRGREKERTTLGLVSLQGFLAPRSCVRLRGARDCCH